jgi:hypothetical protein
MYDAILCIAQSAFTSMKAITTSFRLPPELRQRLEETARRLGRGKNWIIVQALEEYLTGCVPLDLRRSGQLCG